MSESVCEPPSDRVKGSVGPGEGPMVSESELSVGPIASLDRRERDIVPGTPAGVRREGPGGVLR